MQPVLIDKTTQIMMNQDMLNKKKLKSTTERKILASCTICHQIYFPDKTTGSQYCYINYYNALNDTLPSYHYCKLSKL